MDEPCYLRVAPYDEVSKSLVGWGWTSSDSSAARSKVSYVESRKEVSGCLVEIFDWQPVAFIVVFSGLVGSGGS